MAQTLRRGRLDPTDRKILESSHMTATVTTESGSHYTVVTRGDCVVLIHDDKGWALKGDKLTIWDGCLYLWKKNQSYIAHSTRITSCYILSN